MVGAPNAINATLYDKLPFDFIRDIAPIAAIISIPNVMVVSPSLPVKNVPEFIAYAHAAQGKVTMGQQARVEPLTSLASCSRQWRAST